MCRQNKQLVRGGSKVLLIWKLNKFLFRTSSVPYSDDCFSLKQSVSPQAHIDLD